MSHTNAHIPFRKNHTVHTKLGKRPSMKDRDRFGHHLFHTQLFQKNCRQDAALHVVSDCNYAAIKVAHAQ
ncbi:hypothetical protein D3C73_832380 [compost metagenome]